MGYYFLERYPQIITDHNGLKTEVWPIWYDSSDTNPDEVQTTIIDGSVTPEDEQAGGIQFVAYFGVYEDAVDILAVLNNENTKAESEEEDYEDDLEDVDADHRAYANDFEDDDEDYLEPVELPEDVDSFFRRLNRD